MKRREGPLKWIGGIIGAVIVLVCGVAAMIVGMVIFVK